MAVNGQIGGFNQAKLRPFGHLYRNEISASARVAYTWLKLLTSITCAKNRRIEVPVGRFAPNKRSTTKSLTHQRIWVLLFLVVK